MSYHNWKYAKRPSVLEYGKASALLFREFPNLDEEMMLAEVVNKFHGRPLSTSGVVMLRTLESVIPWMPLCAEDCSGLVKCSTTSTLHRERGNQYYALRSYEKALSNYNQAVANAPVNSESAGFAYANRASVLMALGDPDGALEDIDIAIANNYPSNRISRLDGRRQRCMRMIEDRTEAKKVGVELQLEEQYEADRQEAIKLCAEVLFRVKKPNPVLPAAEEFVEVGDDGALGKHLFVTRDVPAGTVLVVDKPFAAVVISGESVGIHCDYCLKKLHRGIPCPTCVFCFFCDEVCLAKAMEEFHSFECGWLRHLCCVVGDEVSTAVLLTVRIVSKIGPAGLLELFHTRKQWFSKGRSKKTPSTELNSQYLPIFQVLKTPEETNATKLVDRASQARILVTMLEKRTAFFSNIPATNREAVKEFLISLVLSHLRSPLSGVILMRTDGIHDLQHGFYAKHPRAPVVQGIVDDLVSLARPMDFGQGFFPVASMLQHSCCPNVSVVAARKEGTVSIVTTRALKKGDRLTAGFSPNYLQLDLPARQAFLSVHYAFKCDCIACREKWPVLDDLYAEHPLRLCCPRCSRKISYELLGSSDFNECVIKGPTFKCRRCKRRYSRIKLLCDIEENYCKTSGAIKLLHQGRPSETMKIILENLKFYQTYACPPLHYMQISQDVFQAAVTQVVEAAGELPGTGK